MNNINRIDGYRPLSPISNQPVQPGSENSAKSQPARADRVEISENAMYLARMQQMPEVRQEKVEAVRQQIQAGTYDIDSKIDVVAERLSEEYTW
ncbi:MAG: flagellar biosynthesis anti-sigma factor FlgM [Phycisphaerae bacterium]|nr:flagellar biosynthesis anti-sigma factor FlgM [Phycisphaerae bacterium]